MNSWQLFTETKDIWNRMLDDIDKAQDTIELEQYSFWDDTIGRKFLKMFEKKHHQGVKIRLICDGYGSYPLFNSAYMAKLIKLGVEIVPFNPVSLVRPSSWFFHLHKKTLILDSKIAWTGGLGLKNKFMNFKDTMARLEGTVVADILKSFETVWRGVDVKIILRGQDDEFLPVRFSTSYFHKALKANIGIYRYESAIIHAKTAIVDGKWATIGSSNLDKFSFYYNMEANISSREPQFVSEVAHLFAENLKNCRQIMLKDWEKRPVFERVMEVVSWPIHNYL